MSVVKAQATLCPYEVL